uniref:uncharacterized protein LOC122598862 n=1 Tax=Erigeron canadensis TaxID=72917 RepID=UPI001CB9B852|nr:uncharacterized protein LOC122598862 [Erigeron canadensis]
MTSSCFPYAVLTCMNFSVFILSGASLVPTIIIRSPPTSMGWALVTVSSISLLSSFLGFYSRLTHFCFVTHVTLLITSLAAQFLAILALFTKENSSLSMLKSPRDPREAMVLVRLECGVLIVMFVMQLGVLCLTYTTNCCLAREYEPVTKKKSTRVAAESMKGMEMETDLKGFKERI